MSRICFLYLQYSNLKCDVFLFYSGFSFPYAIHLCCFSHFRDNSKAPLKSSNVPEEAQEFLFDIFRRQVADTWEKGLYRQENYYLRSFCFNLFIIACNPVRCPWFL